MIPPSCSISPIISRSASDPSLNMGIKVMPPRPSSLTATAVRSASESRPFNPSDISTSRSVVSLNVPSAFLTSKPIRLNSSAYSADPSAASTCDDWRRLIAVSMSPRLAPLNSAACSNSWSFDAARPVRFASLSKRSPRVATSLTVPLRNWTILSPANATAAALARPIRRFMPPSARFCDALSVFTPRRATSSLTTMAGLARYSVGLLLEVHRLMQIEKLEEIVVRRDLL